MDLNPSSTISAFPDSSVSKESTCNSRDPGSIPGSERSPGEGIGYPLQYSWPCLVAQTVKDLPAVRETLVRLLGREDPLEEGMATHSVFLPGDSPWTEEPGGLQSTGSQRQICLSTPRSQPLPSQQGGPFLSTLHLSLSRLSPVGCFSRSFAALPAKRSQALQKPAARP